MKAEELISDFGNLPAPSPSVVKLINLLNRPDTDADDVVEVVEQDPVLSAKLLGVCNSAAFATSEPVASTKQAVLFLGYREVYRLIVAIGFGGPLARSLPGYAIQDGELWHHSLMTGLITQAVLQETGTKLFDSSVAYTAGLIHDIGKIVLGAVLDADTQSRLLERIEETGCSRLEAEREMLETDHSEVGAALLRQWQLPAPLVEAAANHHQPVTTPRAQLSAVVHLADCVAHEAGAAPGWHPYAVRADEAAAQSLGLDAEKHERVLLASQDLAEKADELLKVT